MLTVEEALKLVAKHARPLAPRRVPLGEAAGLVLAEDVTSDVNSPPYDKALMDGYAVVSSDREPVRRGAGRNRRRRRAAAAGDARHGHADHDRRAAARRGRRRRARRTNRADRRSHRAAAANRSRTGATHAAAGRVAAGRRRGASNGASRCGRSKSASWPRSATRMVNVHAAAAGRHPADRQ